MSTCFMLMTHAIFSPSQEVRLRLSPTVLTCQFGLTSEQKMIHSTNKDQWASTPLKTKNLEILRLSLNKTTEKILLLDLMTHSFLNGMDASLKVISPQPIRWGSQCSQEAPYVLSNTRLPTGTKIKTTNSKLFAIVLLPLLLLLSLPPSWLSESKSQSSGL